MAGVAVITGAARGIGAATALRAAASGYTVCVNYLTNEAAAAAVVRTIVDQGGRALAVAADVGSESDVIRLFRTVDAELGPPAVLVNNAGILERQTTVDDMDAARLQRVFSTNVIGAFLCAREAIVRMSTRRGGRGGAIVNVSSSAARLGSPGEYVDYAASKGAIDTMTVGLAREVATQGIRVNAVRAGIIETDLHARGGVPDRVERVKAAIPMQRGGRVEEVARAIMWLASEEASYSTGAILDVAGGR
jgi:NAD(P)-dependent dehydrogenase (short-subunit alcohol dehydrogenase family)